MTAGGGFFERLQTVLRDHAVTAHVLGSGAGRLLVTELGARVLACELAGLDENVFFHDPAMEDAATFRGIAGGDRLWIAPEIAFYWPSLELAREDPARHAATPEAIDPGRYRFWSRSETEVTLAARVELVDVRSRHRVALEVRRQIRSADPPRGLADGLTAVSFAITNELALDPSASDDGAVAGAWDILQMPVGGTLVCPTACRADPRSYYEPFEGRVSFDANRVTFSLDGSARRKLGLRPEETTGRMAYLRRISPRESTLVLRSFPALPGEPYVDLPRSEDARARTGGDCLQAYSDGAGPASFGEMEHHDPACIAGRPPDVRSGTSVTHVLFGTHDLVATAGAALLGVGLET